MIKVSHRVTDWLALEWILQYPCGCAFLWATGEQAAFCPTCPVQLLLPFEDPRDQIC